MCYKDISMQLSNGQTILFIGDSITDCGRDRPVGQSKGLGNGYVNLVNAIIQSTMPEKNFQILNTGISGNRIIDLRDRWQSDVLDIAPDWLSIMIGINDVYRQFDSPQIQQVLINEYETVFTELLEKTVPFLKGLILITPYYIEANPDDPIRSKMDRYAAVVKKMAEKYNALFVDTQAAFCAYLKHKPAESLCDDRIHPDLTGHALIAGAFLKAIGTSKNPLMPLA